MTEIDFTRIWNLQNSISEIAIVDYLPLDYEERILKFEDFVKNKFASPFHSNLDLKADSSFKRDTTFLSYPSLGMNKDPNLDGFKKIEINITRHLGFAFTVVLKGKVNREYISNDLKPTNNGCGELKKRINELEKKLGNYLLNSDSGTLGQDLCSGGLPSKSLLSIWKYNIFEKENPNFWKENDDSSRTKWLESFIRKDYYNKTKYTSDLTYLGLDINKTSQFSSIVKTNEGKGFLLAPGSKYFKSELGRANFRYLVFQIDDFSDEERTLDEVEPDDTPFEIGKLFLPIYWAIWRNNNLKSQFENKSIKPKDFDIQELEDEYHNQIKNEMKFREETEEIKTEIEALRYLIEKRGSLPDEKGERNESKFEDYPPISEELNEIGDEYLNHLEWLIDFYKQVYERNIESLSNLFSAKVSTSNLKFQFATILISIIAAALGLMQVFPNFDWLIWLIAGAIILVSIPLSLRF
ncbi:hypothetical protein AKJ49_02160 [candidate division MSBL1 archaeon SCGC-AAA382A03]|uniref:Uncharacterized protein n=1 Tax=candidate division MSBL1 archaeon SCGC-AAA382A03 TaxID=1698278 RepID=A0A133VD54_9EURY|nr:hypothetical protein AKJ49_02160 [candidate division MSBL1 archaeon SCGC-AAA382A03]